MRYACEVCGCPTICLPEQLTDDAELRCQGCRRQLGTWAEFRERVKAMIMAERSGVDLGRVMSSDPLDEPAPASPDRRAGASFKQRGHLV
jgi:hypothetical protein